MYSLACMCINHKQLSGLLKLLQALLQETRNTLKIAQIRLSLEVTRHLNSTPKFHFRTVQYYQQKMVNIKSTSLRMTVDVDLTLT